jgi:hypothetical protein
MRKLLALIGLVAIAILAWLFFGIDDAKAQEATDTSTVPATLQQYVSDDPKVVWGGGDPKTSSYSGKIVPVAITMLDQNQLPGYKWGGVSDGSLFNAMMVTVNPTHLALCQADICDSLLGTNIPGTDLPYAFTTVQADIADECLYLVTKSSFTNFGQVLENTWDMTVAIGGEQSGSYGSWTKVLVPLYPDLADAELQSVGDASKIVASVVSGQTNFGFFVMRPDPTNEVFNTISENGLTLVPVIDVDMEDVYTFKSLKVENGGILSKAKYHETACTQVQLITGDPAAVEGKIRKRVEATIKRISAIPPETFKQAVVAEFASWKDYLDSVRDIGSERLKTLLDETSAKIAKLNQ